MGVVYVWRARQQLVDFDFSRLGQTFDGCDLEHDMAARGHAIRGQSTPVADLECQMSMSR